MRQRLLFGSGIALTSVLAVACSPDKPLLPPTVPSSAATTGVSLKVDAPTPLQPIGGGRVNTRTPRLTIKAARGLNGNPVVSYEFQVATPAGDVVYTRTSTGGTANGQDVVQHALTTLLDGNVQYRWRARAVSGPDAGPWSDFAGTDFITNALGPESSDAQFRDYFFEVVAARGVAVPTQAALLAMEPELQGVGIIMAKGNDGQPRGRIWLPSGQANKYTRAVDVVSGFGGNSQWIWNSLGPRPCEGICP
jgi:hypothetical protein